MSQSHRHFVEDVDSMKERKPATMKDSIGLLPLSSLLLICISAVMLQDFNLLMYSTSSEPFHRTLQVSEPRQQLFSAGLKTEDSIPKFSQQDIEKALPYFHSWYMRLLAFDGQTWRTYAIGHKSTTLFPQFKSNPRLFEIIPLLVHALVHNFPERFARGQPEFQVLFSEADLISTDCGLTSKQCPSNQFPPLLGFGSVFKETNLLPSLKMFPAPARWLSCLYMYKTRNQRCTLNQLVNFGKLFHELKPQVVWRGADWPFLPHMKEFQSDRFLELQKKTEQEWCNVENSTGMLNHLRNFTNDLPPRWKTVLWTLEEDEKVKISSNSSTHSAWIDSRFQGGLNVKFRDDLNKTGLKVNGERIEEFKMSGYKYQIDTGGGGGTTWDGTLIKLLSPGLLFHHETPTKDFFYDEMWPWKHYVPVKTDLSDLKEKFDWAEANPERSRLIAQEATSFGEYLISSKYMDKLYDELFTKYLGKVVNAYQPHDEITWEQTLQHYRDTGHEIVQLSKCDETHCETEARGETKKFLYRQTKIY